MLYELKKTKGKKVMFKKVRLEREGRIEIRTFVTQSGMPRIVPVYTEVLKMRKDKK